MNLYEASHLARELIARHGLAGWRFSFDHARRRFGRCDYTNRRITLSRPLTLLNTLDEVRDTILHEIAHALCPKDGHGARWRATCRRIGRTNRALLQRRDGSSRRRRAPYRFGCPRCDWWVDRRRLSRRAYLCKHCRGRVIFTPAAGHSLRASLEETGRRV